MITIYWHCLGMTEADETFVNSALKELAQHLKEDPIKLPISVKRFGDEPDIAKQVDAILNRLNDPSYTFSNYAADILYLFLKEGIFKEGVTPKLLVYCRPDSQIANVARRENPSALYGAACGSFAAVYRLDYKVTIWHEALHLLGADDCYEQDNPRKKKPHCKCDENIKKLKDAAEKAKEVHRTKKDS